MPQVSQLYKNLDALLTGEIGIYKRYLASINEERDSIVKFSAEKVLLASAEREQLTQAMAQAQRDREALVKATLQLPEAVSKRAPQPALPKLGEFIRTYCSPAESKVLLSKVDQLKKLVKESRRVSNELAQIVGFSLTMVSGMSSLIWSATKDVVQSYTQSGTMTESSHHAKSRAAGVLKQA